MPKPLVAKGSPGAESVRLGAHMSIAGGMTQAVVRALAVESSALQVFVKNSNRWEGRLIPDDEALAFRQAAEAAGLARHTIAHASYLPNLASPDDTLWKRSVEAVADELRRCAALGIDALVLHPGAHMGAGVEAGLARIVRALDLVLREAAGPRVLLEVTAGQGSSLGATFEELAFVLDRVARPERVGMCFDTCHALSAGYEFRDERSYAALIDALDHTVGLARVRAFHLNDSKTGLGSRRDRHEAIGVGHVGLAAFGFVLNDRRLRGLPMVIETYKGEDLAEDRVNLAALRALIEP